ncbi:hypothetical protein FS749_008088 [Ceratobasidium sp. UAMH 11750]|nr:hypothetical protein FS749_008088 [Ceratobasidium sp. UAMH 11750]
MPDPSFFEALQRLRNAVAALPSSTPIGHPSGTVYRAFKAVPSSRNRDPWTITSEVYTRCFADNPASGKRAVDNILRGRYGMDCVVAFFADFENLPGVSSSSLFLVERKIEQLTDLVYERIRLLNPGYEKPIATKNAVPRKQISSDPEHESNDPTYTPKEDLSHLMDDNDETDEESEGRETPTNAIARHSKVEGHGAASTRPGPSDAVRQWALSNFEAPTAGEFINRPGAAWVFKCKHCGVIRRVPRTPGCETIEHEPRPVPASNLASHLRNQCKKIPQAESWEAATARNQQFDASTTPDDALHSLGARFASETPIPPPPPTALSNRVFWSTLIQGVVRDNFAMTFGEGEGMKQVFRLVNPLVVLPSHQTMHRYLDGLYGVLSNRLAQVMQEETSRVSMTSDAWSSKSSVYSLAGVVGTFIDKHWNLQEVVLDIVHLDADHAGAAMGQKVFWSLKRRNAARNLIASVTDNGSNNRTMNEEIVSRAGRELGRTMNEENMSIICVAILSSLGIVDLTDEDDGYDIAKAFNLGERVEESEEIRNKESRMQGGHNQGDIWAPAEESDDDLSDYASDSESDEHEDQDRWAKKPAGPTNAEKPRPKGGLNPAQKIHAIAVHCTASPQRRKIMGGFIRLYCSVILAVIKSMVIRWNTVLAELRRALLLRPAFDHWVNTLDTGKTGKARRVAQKLKQRWTMSDREWLVVEELVSILQPFEEATLSFSKKGKPHLPDVLPTYVQLRSDLQNAYHRLQKMYGVGNDPFGLLKAISDGQCKLEKYFGIACRSDLPLITSILHPGMRLRYFENEHIWGKTMQRGRLLLEHLFETYKHELQEARDVAASSEQPDRPKLQKSTWFDRLLQLSGAEVSALDDELSRFFGNVYAFKRGTNILKW